MKVIVAPEELMGHPDILAMLQAFYSRSHESMESRLHKLSEGTLSPSRIRESLKSYYVNYGHESIGDCGNITLFIEGVSFLTAKAIQDHPLYNGQETSSRYINFANQQMPTYLTPDTGHEAWMDLYRRAFDPVLEHIARTNPELDERGRFPKAFDILRGLLPVTGLTQLSWTGSIRTIRNHLAALIVHPEPLVQRDCAEILHVVQQVYPDLYGTVEPDHSKEWYIDSAEDILSESGFYHGQASWRNLGSIQRERYPSVERTFIGYNSDWLDAREDSTHLARYGTNSVYNALDYAGYRDVQRHRASYTKSDNPMTSRLGLHPWYLEQLPTSLHSEIDRVYRGADIPPLMGLVGVSQTADLPQWRYYVNMRTKPAVHHTVRAFSTENAETILAHYPNLEWLFEINRDGVDYARRAKATILHNGEQIQ